VAISSHEKAWGRSFEYLRSWADEAIYRIRTNRHDLPSTQQLRDLFEADNPFCSIILTKVTSYDDGSQKRSVIGLKTKKWPAEAKTFRHVLPAHFAIIRALELVHGARIYLEGDRNMARDRRKGVHRSRAELIFDLKLSIPKTRGTARIETKIDRILFNVDAHTSLYARRTGDHHFILPSGSVPIAARIRDGRYTDRQRVLRSVKERMRLKSQSEPFASVVGLLQDLFFISDELHWSELIDRLPKDKAYRQRDFANGFRRLQIAKHPTWQGLAPMLIRD